MKDGESVFLDDSMRLVDASNTIECILVISSNHASRQREVTDVSSQLRNTKHSI